MQESHSFIPAIKLEVIHKLPADATLASIAARCWSPVHSLLCPYLCPDLLFCFL
jgi:hypothetical protein